MKKCLGQNWGKVALGLILVMVVVLNFRWGYFVLGNDNYSPELNPALSMQRYWKNPTWRGYRGLGVPSDAEQIDIFRSGLFVILEKIGIPLWLISQMSVWVIVVLGPMGMGWLTKRLFKKEESFLAGGIIYFSSLLTLWLFFSPLKPFIFFWGFLPLFVAVSDKVAERGDFWNWLIWFAVLIGLSNAFIVPTLFFVSLVVLIAMGVVLGLKSGRWKKLVNLFLVFLVWQLYWLVPFGSYVKSQSGQLQDSFINRAITSGTIQDERQYNSLANVVRGVTSWVNLANDNGTKLFSYGQRYQGGLFMILGYVTFVLAILGLGVGIKKKKKYIWGLGVLMTGGVWLIKGSNPPLGFWYEWLTDNVPLFYQVFRWGSSKFWPFLWLPMVILATYGWLVLAKNKRLKYLAWVGLLGCLVYMFPAFKGELINKGDFVRIPQEYYELRDYLAKRDTIGRVYMAPESNMLYFKNHDWGFFGSVFWSYFIPNPIIEKALVTGSTENEMAFKKIVNLYYSEEPQLLAKILNNYKVKWLIGDKSLTDKGNGYEYNWDTYRRVIDQNPYLVKMWQSGDLELYQVMDVGEVVLNESGENLLYQLGEGKVFGEGGSEIDGGWRIENKNETSGIYWEVSDPDIGGNLIKISAEVKNESGIVAQINFRETKKEYQTYSYLAKMGEEEKMMGYFYLPRDWRNNLLELIVRARGPDVSVNEIKNLKMEVMPLTADYFKAEMPSSEEWVSRGWMSYAGWVIDAGLVVFLLVRQALKRQKTNFSGSKKTTKA